MIFPSQLKPNKIKEFLLKICTLAAERLFLSSLVLMFISLLFGLAIFYKYNILPQKLEPELETEVIKFQEDIYQKILETWESRGEKFEEARTKEYTDPFKP